jgi:hypothetical protein
MKPQVLDAGQRQREGKVGWWGIITPAMCGSAGQCIQNSAYSS